MDIFAFSVPTFFSFLLTLMRVSLVVFLLPFFGGKTTPKLIKAALCLLLTCALFPTLNFSLPTMPTHPLQLALLLGSELLLGLVLGLLVHFIFAAIQTGGQIIGFQMGFSMLSIADPLSGSTSNVCSTLLYIVSLLLFLTLNGHLVMLHGLASTFSLIPPGGLVLGSSLVTVIFTHSAQLFVLALKIAAPVMSILLLVEFGLAFMGRAAPEMNLLTLGFPLKIAIGFYFMGLLFSVLAKHIAEVVQMLPELMDSLIKAASPLFI